MELSKILKAAQQLAALIFHVEAAKIVNKSILCIANSVIKGKKLGSRTDKPVVQVFQWQKNITRIQRQDY